MRRLVVVGDSLLDRDLDGRVERLCPDAPVPVLDAPVERPRPGGAALAAALAAREGRPVTLVTALADDAAAAELRALLDDAGVEVAALPLDGATPEKVRVRATGRPLLRLDYGGEPGHVGAWTPSAQAALADAGAILVADYGRGTSAEPTVRTALEAAARTHPVVWDPHPRGHDPVSGVRLATPNSAEAARLVPDPPGFALPAATARARTLLRRWGVAGVSITLGEHGALLVAADGTPLAVPAPEMPPGVLDVCGAGDCYAAHAAGALADGALLSEAVTAAAATASAFVAAGGPAAFATKQTVIHIDDADDAGRVVRRVRDAGGTVVATGGCFDVLHAGHVQMLQAARRLGDCLVVCLNSDASVRRLKGPTRPVVTAADRATVLLGLGCVDGVAIFDEDTPEAILDWLRPDIWAKGADYAVTDLPEAALVASWGGQAVVLPYLDDHSTTRILQEALRHA